MTSCAAADCALPGSSSRKTVLQLVAFRALYYRWCWLCLWVLWQWQHCQSWMELQGTGRSSKMNLQSPDSEEYMCICTRRWSSQRWNLTAHDKIAHNVTEWPWICQKWPWPGPVILTSWHANSFDILPIYVTTRQKQISAIVLKLWCGHAHRHLYQLHHMCTFSLYDSLVKSEK